MAIVTGLTADRMLQIEGQSIVDARLDGDVLILTSHDGVDHNVGSVRGPTGSTGPAGSVDSVNGKSGPNVSLVATDLPDLVPITRVATTSLSGILSLASYSEVNAGADNTKAVTPSTLSNYMSARLGLKTILYFTASGTFQKSAYPDAKFLLVRLVGGGGGGGGVGISNTGNHCTGGGGGGGGYAERLINVTALSELTTITVGSAGTGGAAGTSSGNIGGTGGATSFGTLVVANGGSGGQFVTNIPTYASAPGGATGLGTAGDMKSSGQPGHIGTGNATLGIGGAGGMSLLGGGAPAVYGGGGGGMTSGAVASGYGGGGSGGATNAASTGGAPGGNGYPGLVIVEVLA